MCQHHGRSQNRAEGICHILPGDGWGGAMYRFEHRCLAGVNISAGGQAQAALKPGGEVGDDIAEHVVGHDYVEWAWVAHHLHTERVYIHVLRFDLWMFAADFFEYSLPKTSGVSHGIRLIAHEHALAGRTIGLGVLLTVLEGIADDALHTLARVNVFLRRDFVWRALLEDSASVGVNAFRVFADHHEIHIFRFDAL